MHAIFILTNKSKSYSYVVKLFKIITINKILLILFDILPTILRKTIILLMLLHRSILDIDIL